MDKFRGCTHVMSYGCSGSSSAYYASDEFQSMFKPLNAIDAKSIVGLSTNGSRPDRVTFPVEQLEWLKNVGCRLVTDNYRHRSRPYNIGEREIAEWLTKNGYADQEDNIRCVWTLIKHETGDQ